jgi:hypothetical protein
MKPNKPNCFDCTRSSKFAGSSGTLYEPPEEPVAECNEPAGEALQELYGNDAAPRCALFNPIMALACDVCKAAINQPAWSWTLWVSTMGDAVPVCSVVCRVIGEEAFEREMANERASIESDYLYEDRPALRLCKDCGAELPDIQPIGHVLYPYTGEVIEVYGPELHENQCSSCQQKEFDIMQEIGIANQLLALGVTFDQYGHASYQGESTDPYGLIEWSVGNDEDFHCFDYLVLPGGYIAIHSVVNSETGSFIQDASYEIAPIDQAERAAQHVIDQAWTWCYDNEVFEKRKPTEDGEGELTDHEFESQRQAGEFIKNVLLAVKGAPE